MKLYLLLGVLLVAQAWASPVEEESIDQLADEVTEEEPMPAGDDAYEPEDEENVIRGGYEATGADPCYTHNCPIGQQCELDDNGEASCTCIDFCEDEEPKVCSTTNVTFSNECELMRQRCLCDPDLGMPKEGCVNRDYGRAHMAYYGACKLQDCTQEQLDDFPVRMRTWLSLVMGEMLKRKQLGSASSKLAEKAEHQDIKWKLPTIWKFCSMDKSGDHYVDPMEIRELTVQLQANEACTGRFVENCDKNDDGDLTIDEWVICLGLRGEDTGNKQIQRMNAICDKIHQEEKRDNN